MTTFIPNYKTADNIFEIKIDMDSLVMETYEPQKWITDASSTPNSIDVYNTSTKAFSTKGLYLTKKGLYFKGMGTRYYIKDLIPIN